MRPSEHYDYAAWRCQFHAWPSVDAFLSATEYADGIHSIDCDGLPLDLLFHGKPMSSVHRVLPVFFSGAVSARQGKRPPFFSGLGVARSLNVPAICVADTSVAVNPTMTLAWYAGSAKQGMQILLSKLLEAIAVRSGNELLMIGGSGGGFAAIYYGYALGARASVLAWNPQTDWLEYDVAVARHYLSTAYPDEAWPACDSRNFKEIAASFLLTHGVTHSVVSVAKAAFNVPRRLVYLQNASDWHVIRHAKPFMEVLSLTDAGEGFHLTHQPQGIFWFGNWGAGHIAPPKELVEYLVQCMLVPERMPADLVDSVKSSSMSVYVDAVAAPRDLRRNIFDAKVEVVTTGKNLRAIIHSEPVLEGHHQISYAFYVYSGEERIAIRWYGPDNALAHAEVEGKPATRIAAFMRDGFGHQLLVRETREIVQADAQLAHQMDG